jgi:hypothetical protein
MSNNDREEALLRRIKNSLDASSATLDAATCTRLRVARARALQHQGTRHAWLLWPAGGVALAATALLSWVLWFNGPATHPPAALEQLELLSSTESLELYTDLDFYQWLTSATDAS